MKTIKLNSKNKIELEFTEAILDIVFVCSVIFSISIIWR